MRVFTERISIVIGVLAAFVVLSLPAAPAWVQERAAAGVSIGPGRVVFTVSPVGRWGPLVPAWDRDQKLVTHGGFVVMATNADEEYFEVANTISGQGIRVSKTSKKLSPVHEGIEGGARRPLPVIGPPLGIDASTFRSDPSTFVGVTIRRRRSGYPPIASHMRS